MAILTFFLLVVALLAATQGIARPPSAHASVTSGDVIFARNFSFCSYEQIAKYSGGTETDLSGCKAGDQMPAVSPDGSRIVFQRGWPGGSAPGDMTENGLWVMNSDGSGATQITQDCLDFTPPSTCGTSYSDENPSWSPDGTKIVFTRQITGSGYEIDTVNADGSGLTTLVSGSSLLTGGPTSWSPDGTKILYTDSSGDLRYVNPSTDATGLVLDTSYAGADYDPVWSPDGTRIYFDNGSDVFGFTYSSPSDITQLDSGGGYEPTVSSNGSTVAYTGSDAIYAISSSASEGTGSRLAATGNGDNEPAYVLSDWPGNATVSLKDASVSDAPYTRQIAIHLSTSGVGSFEYGWSSSSTTAPNTSYLQSTTDLSGTATLDYLGYFDEGTNSYVSGTGTTPDSDWYLWVRSVQTGGTPNAWGTPLKIHTPKKPAWIGLGDSYSSGWHQSSSHYDCFIEDSTCGVTSPDNSYSWLSSAVSDFNSTLHVPSAWQITEYNDANGGVATSSLGDSDYSPGTYQWAASDTPAGYMRIGLASQADSWNVVSVTGGGVDAGLSTVLGDWYIDIANYTNWGDEPWTVTTSGDCPDTASMYSYLTTGSPTGNDTIKANLQGIVDVAAATSPSVRVLSVGYPEILDYFDTCQSGTTGAGAVIGQLNDDHSGLTGSNVQYVDLATAFGTTPISDGDIQETYDFGYPHPSSTGQALIGTAASDKVTGGGW
jgi:hypothetical protein